MHLEHEIATSRYLYGNDYGLIFHSFPYQNYVTTWDMTTYESHGCQYNKNSITPAFGYDVGLGGKAPFPVTPDEKVNTKYLLAHATDSASAATAMATGHKTPKKKISPDLKTIAEMSREQKGFSIGVVTTVPFNHATPAAFIAHNNHRDHYYTGYKGYGNSGIADQIINETKPEVVIGAGHPLLNNPKFQSDKGYISQVLYGHLRFSKEYIFAEKANHIHAGRILESAAKKAITDHKKLFGLFGDTEGKFSGRYPASDGQPRLIREHTNDPTLSEAALAALEVLSQDKDGFFVMIEQGDIDWANHDNDFRSMITSMVDLNEAVQSIVNFIDQPEDDITWDNTLLIVTADHANSFMRLQKIFEKGRLPQQRHIPWIFFKKIKYLYRPDEVRYSLADHTNELVSIYSKGCCVALFKKHEYQWYPQQKIIDNTHIFDVMKEAAGLN